MQLLRQKGVTVQGNLFFPQNVCTFSKNNGNHHLFLQIVLLEYFFFSFKSSWALDQTSQLFVFLLGNQHYFFYYSDIC